MKKTNKFPIYSRANRLSSNSQKALTIADTKKLGEIKNKQVVYTAFEAFYLIKIKKAELIKNNKKLTQEQAEKVLLKNKELQNKYLVFEYLKNRGYIVKTGLKFGGEFRVYEKNKKHATYITYIINKNINIQEFISKNRIAHSTAKKLLLAIIDDEESILFYDVNWTKL